MEPTRRPFQPGVIQPGMERVIEAGDTLVIQDSVGQEFAVKAIEGNLTMEFLKTFDTWLAAKNRGVQGVVLDSFWAQVTKTFNALPMYIQRELPTFKDITALIPG